MSPNTPVGPVDKEKRIFMFEKMDTSPQLRGINAGDDRNVTLNVSARARCNTVSGLDNMPGTPDMYKTRSKSMVSTSRKKRIIKRKLIPGQTLLPEMFGGLFKPVGAKCDGEIDARNNVSDGPVELKK